MATGGVGFGGKKRKKGKKKGKGLGGPILPPWMSYDPQIGAEMRAQGRGLKDILKDTKRARRYASEDYRTSLADIDADWTRGMRDIGLRRKDIQTQATRGRENFANQLTNLIRNFQIQGREQTQAANAAGVLPGGSAARAAAARRGENLAHQRKPIDIGRERLEQDVKRDLGRLGIAQRDLLSAHRRNVGLAGTDFRRTNLDLGTKRRRAIRERRIGKLDLINQAIFQARERKPGAFTMFGQPKKKRRRF